MDEEISLIEVDLGDVFDWESFYEEPMAEEELEWGHDSWKTSVECYLDEGDHDSINFVNLAVSPEIETIMGKHWYGYIRASLAFMLFDWQVAHEDDDENDPTSCFSTPDSITKIIYCLIEKLKAQKITIDNLSHAVACFGKENVKNESISKI